MKNLMNSIINATRNYASDLDKRAEDMRFSRSLEGHKKYFEIVRNASSTCERFTCNLAEFKLLMNIGCDTRHRLDYRHSNIDRFVKTISISWSHIRNLDLGVESVPVRFRFYMGIDLESKCNWMFCVFAGIGKDRTLDTDPGKIVGELYKLPLDIELMFTQKAFDIEDQFLSQYMSKIEKKLAKNQQEPKKEKEETIQVPAGDIIINIPEDYAPVTPLTDGDDELY